MDPEDLREVISAYQKCVARAVQRFAGFVAKYMGDGVQIYFGYPQAHEDDAERAVRAGLELVAAVGGLKTHAPLQTRVGIATGLVVVGDLIGSGPSQERAIVGDTPNVAARLQGVAEPNSVVIAESTRKLVGNLFELEDRGVQDLKGIAGPVHAWAALRPASVESRFDALHATTILELVGREEELELLLRHWSRAKNREGQVVLLSGEPGIGKSRLTAALMERLANEPYTRLRYFCSPQHTDSALYPIISQMERTAGFARDDTAQAKLDKLDALLAQSFTPRQDATLLAEMLSLAGDGRYPNLDLTSLQRRQEALASQIVSLIGCRRQGGDILCGNYAMAIAQVDDVVALADEKAAMFWKVQAMLARGMALALSDKANAAVQVITSNIAALRAAGATVWSPMWLSYLASAHAQLGQYDNALRSLGEGMMLMETTGERWFEAEANRITGQIVLLSPEPDVAKAEVYFERALEVARRQQAKSWELCASMSLARLWRDQGKVQQARELLAPVYGWFTEGFDTRDLKEAKALLEELAA
jgi:class 3 adenylate cyclase